MSGNHASHAEDDRHEARDLGWVSVVAPYVVASWSRCVDARNSQECDVRGQEHSALEKSVLKTAAGVFRKEGRTIRTSSRHSFCVLQMNLVHLRGRDGPVSIRPSDDEGTHLCFKMTKSVYTVSNSVFDVISNDLVYRGEMGQYP